MPQRRSAVTKPEQGKGGDIHLLETESCRSSSAGHVAPAQHAKPCFLNGDKSDRKELSAKIEDKGRATHTYKSDNPNSCILGYKMLGKVLDALKQMWAGLGFFSFM